MAFKNNERTDWTFENLKFKPTDTLLEVGFGPGVTFKKVADNLTSGFIAGIDHSEEMFKQAANRNKKNIDTNKAKLECGAIWDLKYPDDHFDIIFGSNVHFFWEHPEEEFKKLGSLLKSGGRLLMVFQPRWVKSEEHLRNVAEKTKKQFEEAGLINIEIDFKKMKPVTCICVSGQK